MQGAMAGKTGVTDGARTRDSWIHNPALYRLSYGYQNARAAYARGSEAQALVHG